MSSLTQLRESQAAGGIVLCHIRPRCAATRNNRYWHFRQPASAQRLGACCGAFLLPLPDETTFCGPGRSVEWTWTHPCSDIVFGRFGRHISHRDQLSPERAPEQPGDGGQRHSDVSVLQAGVEDGDTTTSRSAVTDTACLTFSYSLRARRNVHEGARASVCVCVCVCVWREREREREREWVTFTALRQRRNLIGRLTSWYLRPWQLSAGHVLMSPLLQFCLQALKTFVHSAAAEETLTDSWRYKETQCLALAYKRVIKRNEM